MSGYDNLPTPGTFDESDTIFQSATYLGQDVRIATARRSIALEGGQAFLQVSVAQTLTGMNLALARISRISLGVGVGFFVLSVIIAMLIAQSTIRQPMQWTNCALRDQHSDDH